MTLPWMILLVWKISMVLSVLALGLNATFSESTYLFRRPGELIRAVFSIYVVMPLLALGLVLTFHLHPAVKIALVVLSVTPVPPVFPRNAVKAGGRDNYSVGLLVATAVLAIVVIPIAMMYFERIGGVRLETPVHATAALVLATVLMPLVVGIAIRDGSPYFAKQIAEPVSKWATALLILSAPPVLIGSMSTIPSLFGDGTLVSLAVFAVAGYLIGDFFGRPEFDSRRVLGLATSSRHPALAAAIAHEFFPEQRRALPAIVLYLIVSAVVTGVASRRRPRPTGLPSKRTEKKIAA